LLACLENLYLPKPKKPHPLPIIKLINQLKPFRREATPKKGSHMLASEESRLKRKRANTQKRKQTGKMRTHHLAKKEKSEN